MRIAIVGTGISGMVAAYLLSEDHDISVYEANDYVGGHTHTHDIVHNGEKYAVDTGFIVFNRRTYPNFVKLMSQLGVAWQDSNMSFSVRCEKTGLEFRPSTLNTLFAQRRNLLQPAFYRMILDAFRFKRQSRKLIQADRHHEYTLMDFLKANKYSRWFVDYFIIPMGSAIWSAAPDQFRQFPARYFAEFFENHGFLSVTDQPRWLTIKGGSKQYIAPLTRRYKDKIRLNCRVRCIRRRPDCIEVQADGLEPEFYDYLILAAHSDQALALLDDPSDKEIEILGNIAYQENDTVLHTDRTLLPQRRIAWAAWNYRIPAMPVRRASLTYDMNILQNLDADDEFCVTLNMTPAIDPIKIIKRLTYHHPVYSPSSLAARRRYAEINGHNRTYYCGAYWFYGFHEDGVKSALEVGKHFGKKL